MSWLWTRSACISATRTILSAACLVRIKLFNLPTSALPVHKMNTEQTVPQRGIMNNQRDVWRESPDSAHKCQPELSASSRLSEASGAEGICRAPRVEQLQKCASVQSRFKYLQTPGLHTALQAHFEQVNASFHPVPISEKVIWRMRPTLLVPIPFIFAPYHLRSRRSLPSCSQ